MNEITYIITKVRVLPYSISPEMIYPLEVYWFTDNEEEAIKQAKKIKWMYWEVNKF